MLSTPRLIFPTRGQVQVPGDIQSYARVICSITEPAGMTEYFTVAGEPSLGVPDFGFISWRYTVGGVKRYGAPVFVRLAESVLVSDQPQFPFDQVMVVPRLGVNMNVSLRRVAI